jgi:hypothetical protein
MLKTIFSSDPEATSSDWRAIGKSHISTAVAVGAMGTGPRARPERAYCGLEPAEPFSTSPPNAALRLRMGDRTSCRHFRPH